MTPPPIISNQRDLLQAIADGGQPYQTRKARPPGQHWGLKNKDGLHTRILFSTAEALRRKGYIKPAGLLYWRLTDAARLHLKVEARRSMHCTRCDHKRRQHGKYRCLAVRNGFTTGRCTCTGFKEHTP